MSRAKDRADKLAEKLSAPVERVPNIPAEDFLSTGSTLVDLAFSGRPGCGVPKGTYWFIVGDSGAMKTWATFLLFAEAARNPNFKRYRFVHDNAENGALMDMERYFGKGVRDRLEAPCYEGKGKARLPLYSRTVEEFYYHLDMNTRPDGPPCIYVLDSMDAINSKAAEDKFDAEVEKYETGRGKPPGSMGVEKAKVNNQNINRVVQALRPTGSILVVVGQTRDKIGGLVPGQKTRSGGHGLRFFAHLECWTSIRRPLTRTYLSKDREYGSRIKFDVTKNRVSGWEGRFEIDFIKGYGVDDLGSCVNFLVDERHWEVEGKSKEDADGKSRGVKSRSSDADDDNDKKTIIAPEFDFKGTKDELVKRIEDDGDEHELRVLTAKRWNEIVAKACPPRKPRYT